MNCLNSYYKQDCIRAKKLTQVLRKAEVMCKLCRLAPESVPNILSSCAALAQNKCLFGHNLILKSRYFEILQDLKLIESVPPWYSPTIPKLMNESEEEQLDVSASAEQQEVRMNKVDAHIINHYTKQVITLEMSCALIANREKKSEEKTLKYGPLRWE